MTPERLDAASCDLDPDRRPLEPVVVVVFGATGDLTHRKIAPALYNLARSGVLNPESALLGFARRPIPPEAFRAGLREACAGHSHTGLDPALWERFAPRLSYLQGDLDDPAAYARLAALLAEPGTPKNALFYLAVAPDQFGLVARRLAAAGLGTAGRDPEEAGPWRRLVVEKPFGCDRHSAHELNRLLQDCFAEKDIFRIDHYLGKETVQNLLYFRFANSVFEPLWNRRYVERVEIDVFETGGIGTRGGYYDRAGAARDMLQNHLVQLLCLTAMEPPSTLDPESIREEKVKVLRSIPAYSLEEYAERSVRGQYLGGRSPEGRDIPDYLSEPKVRPGSRTETYAALRLEVDNWRFAGVPFLLRTGKALDRQASEIRVHFKRPPETLFAGYCRDKLEPNSLVVRIQPEEGLLLAFNSKTPGVAGLKRGDLRFSYRERNTDYFPEAYERLLADAMAGDSTLFIRFDEAEEAWRVIDGLEEAWASPSAPPLVRYPAGASAESRPLAPPEPVADA